MLAAVVVTMPVVVPLVAVRISSDVPAMVAGSGR